MRNLLFAALSASALLGGAGSAFAAGLPIGATPSVYGAAWAAQQLESRNRNAPLSVASELKTDPAPAPATTRLNVVSCRRNG